MLAQSRRALDEERLIPQGWWTKAKGRYRQRLVNSKQLWSGSDQWPKPWASGLPITLNYCRRLWMSRNLKSGTAYGTSCIEQFSLSLRSYYKSRLTRGAFLFRRRLGSNQEVHLLL
jgi:hypothetical protein